MRIIGTVLAATALLAGCGDGAPADCQEYSDHITELIDQGALDKVEVYLEAHEQWAAERTASDSQICVTAAIEGMLSVEYNKAKWELED